MTITRVPNLPHRNAIPRTRRSPVPEVECRATGPTCSVSKATEATSQRLNRDLWLRYSDFMAPRIATANVVGFSELLDFIRPRHRMVLTTFRADASLQSSPVTGGIDGQGRVVIASYPRRAKSVNIRRNRKASVVVLSDEFNGAYVQLDGDAEVIDVPEAVELLVDYYRAGGVRWPPAVSRRCNGRRNYSPGSPAL
jgi:PPOX class probable F420-dependent enzyme